MGNLAGRLQVMLLRLGLLRLHEWRYVPFWHAGWTYAEFMEQVTLMVLRSWAEQSVTGEAERGDNEERDDGTVVPGEPMGGADLYRALAQYRRNGGAQRPDA